MKKKIKLKIFRILGIIPYSMTALFSLIVIFTGINTCALNKHLYSCEILYGFRSLGYVWYRLLYMLYPMYLGLLILLIYINPKRKHPIRKKLLIGISPIILSITAFLFALLSKTSQNTANLYSSIFTNNKIILLFEILGIIYLCLLIFKKPKKKDIQ